MTYLITLLIFIGAGLSSKSPVCNTQSSTVNQGVTDTSGLQTVNRHVLTIIDTTISVGQRKIRSYSVNGSFPPKLIALKMDERAELRFVNRSREAVYIKLSDEFTVNRRSGVVESIPSGGELVLVPATNKAIIHTYQLYRFEQEGTGAIGSVVVKYEK